MGESSQIEILPIPVLHTHIPLLFAQKLALLPNLSIAPGFALFANSTLAQAISPVLQHSWRGVSPSADLACMCICVYVCQSVIQGGGIGTRERD